MSSRVALVVLVAGLFLNRTATADGLFYADRGVRPLGRAGAFVAGADDLGALAYNPAGLFEAGSQVLVDAAWFGLKSSFTRAVDLQQVDPNTGQTVGTYRQTFPTVRGSAPVAPIPTLAISFKPHPRWVLALGAWAPTAALTSYPETVGGRPAPQRYSLINMDGSALVTVGAGAAYAVSPTLHVGLVLEALVGTFQSTSDFSTCLPDRFLCAPEEPSWDGLAQVRAGPIVAPTASLGATWIPSRSLRMGVSIQLPTYVRSPATLTSRLPTAAVFAQASQVGDEGHLAFDLPWTVRMGVETRILDGLRLELAGNFDRWSMHDSITFAPDNIAVRNVAGLSAVYPLSTVVMSRGFQDAVGVHLGAECSFRLMDVAWDARGGVSYETSAVPKGYESVLTLDQDKLTTAVGVSMHLQRLRFDVTYAHVFGLDVTVDPKEARITLINPLQANPPKTSVPINAGAYSARADILGIGMAYTFGGTRDKR